MDPNNVAPITKMQMLPMAKFRLRNGWRSNNGYFAFTARRMKPTVRTTPRMKLIRTGALV